MKNNKVGKILKGSLFASILLGAHNIVTNAYASGLDMVAYAGPGGFGDYPNRTFTESIIHFLKEYSIPIIIFLFVVFFFAVGFVTVIKGIIKKVRNPKKDNNLPSFKQ